jgi:hypothetical protein
MDEGLGIVTLLFELWALKFGNNQTRFSSQKESMLGNCWKMSEWKIVIQQNTNGGKVKVFER